MTDAEFLTRYVRDRDQHAFATIVARHAGLVAGAARRLAPFDADDVAQAAFVLLARRAPSLTGRANLAGWLYQTTRRCAANARTIRRRRERRLALAAAREAASSSLTSPARNDVAALLDGALAALPTATRDVVLLRHLESLSVAETAERLGVPMTTVTKRSERGLSRLRDFFAARGHASLGVAGVKGALATIAASSTANANAIAAGATSPSIAPSVAALAKTASPLPLVGAAAAALAIATGVAVAVRVDRPTPAAAAAATSRPALVPATAPATLPTGVTQEAAQLVATAFLDRVRDRDVAGVAALLAPGADALAVADLIRTLRDGEYARFPQRLALGGNGSFEMEPTVFNADGTPQPTSPGGPRLIAATLESQTPIEADVGRTLVKLSVVGDAWRVTSARFVYFDQRPVEPRDPPTMFVSRDVARRARAVWDRAQRAEAGFDFAKLTAADLPALRTAMVDYDAAFATFVEALRGSSLALAEADIATIRSLCAKAIAMCDRGASDELRQWMRDVDKEQGVAAAGDRLNTTVRKLDATLDVAEDEVPTGKRPPSFGPEVTLRLAWLSDRSVRLRGPATMPAWLVETRAWKQWERQHDIKTFRTRDDAGNAYEVAVAGAKKDPASGALTPMLQSVRQYRADGTLAAVAEYGWDDFASSWGEFDETGRRYTFRASARRADRASPAFVDRVRFFGRDGTIRRWQTNAPARDHVWIEELMNPVGDLLRTMHLVLKNGRETMDPADDLPIDGLPLIVE